MRLHPTSQEQPLGQNTPEQNLPIDRGDNDDQVHQTNPTCHNTPTWGSAKYKSRAKGIRPKYSK